MAQQDPPKLSNPNVTRTRDQPTPAISQTSIYDPFSSSPPPASNTSGPLAGTYGMAAGPAPMVQSIVDTPTNNYGFDTLPPALNLELRDLPEATIRLLEDRARLYGSSLNQSTYTSGKSHAAIDGIYYKLRGETVRCNPKYGGFLELPNEQVNPDSAAAIYSDRFTPPITLQSVTISQGGQYGGIWVLEAAIACYTIDDLEIIEENFLVPMNKIYFSAGSKKGWAPNEPEASNFQLPNYWESANTSDFALRVTNYTFAYSQGKWLCTFRAVGVEDLFMNLRIPYTLECKNITYLDGYGKTQVAQGIGQALYFVDAVGTELSSLSAVEKSKVIGPGTFKDFDPIGGIKQGDIIPFEPSFWHNQHYVLTGDDGTTYSDPIGGIRGAHSYGVRLYFSFDYVVNRLINDLVLKAAVKDTGFIEAQMNELLKKDKWFIKFDDKTATQAEVPPESELPFLSADPAKIIFLGRANYKNDDGLGVDFTEEVRKVNGEAFPKAVNGNIVNIKNIMIHGSVIEEALRQATKNEITEGADTQVLTIGSFLKVVCDTVTNCTGGFVKLSAVIDPILDILAPGEPLPSLIVNNSCGGGDTYKCVEFDPIKGDGSTRSIDITSGVGSQEYQAAMMAEALSHGDGEIGAALRDCGVDQRPLQEAKKAALEKKIEEIKQRMGPQKFITTDTNDAKSTWAQYYNFRKSFSDKADALDQQGKVYLFPSLSITAVLHGIWGFKVGQFLTSTAVPNHYRVNGSNAFNNKGIPFMIMGVTNILDFAKNDWSTTLTTILCYPPDQITKIDLRAIAQAG